MPKTKDGGFIIDDKPVLEKDIDKWAEEMIKKAKPYPREKLEKEKKSNDLPDNDQGA
jgi:hypothetical protein